MALTNKPLDQIVEADLQELVDAQAPEKLTLDYKATLPGSTDGDKKEFLADVSSFANAAGGHLVFGIAEGPAPGRALTMPGVNAADGDAAIRRLEQMAIDGLEPRIPGLATVNVPLANGTAVIVMRIPHSWVGPHRVSFSQWDRFYARRSAGKYRMDIGEVRGAFAQSGTTMDQVLAFQRERLNLIREGDVPASFEDDSRLVLHLIPLSAFDPSTRYDLSHLPDGENWRFIKTMGATNFEPAHNFDGVAGYRPHAYTQVFRNGIIESVRAPRARPDEEPPRLMGMANEDMILTAIRTQFLPLLNGLSVEPPIVILVSVLGARGWTVIPNNPENYSMDGVTPIARDTLALPNVMIDSYDADVPRALKPAFDVLWNASGWPRSMGYNEDGTRRA